LADRREDDRIVRVRVLQAEPERGANGQRLGDGPQQGRGRGRPVAEQTRSARADEVPDRGHERARLSVDGWDRSSPPGPFLIDESGAERGQRDRGHARRVQAVAEGDLSGELWGHDRRDDRRVLDDPIGDVVDAGGRALGVERHDLDRCARRAAQARRVDGEPSALERRRDALGRSVLREVLDERDREIGPNRGEGRGRRRRVVGGHAGAGRRCGGERSDDRGRDESSGHGESRFPRRRSLVYGRRLPRPTATPTRGVRRGR
jgi:hypothetical protein